MARESASPFQLYRLNREMRLAIVDKASVKIGPHAADEAIKESLPPEERQTLEEWIESRTKAQQPSS